MKISFSSTKFQLYFYLKIPNFACLHIISNSETTKMYTALIKYRVNTKREIVLTTSLAVIYVDQIIIAFIVQKYIAHRSLQSDFQKQNKATDLKSQQTLCLLHFVSSVQWQQVSMSCYSLAQEESQNNVAKDTYLKQKRKQHTEFYIVSFP